MNWHFARVVAPAPQARARVFRYLIRYWLAVSTEGGWIQAIHLSWEVANLPGKARCTSFHHDELRQL